MIESGTWTVLFTDIVGSTEVRTRLGDDEADVLFGGDRQRPSPLRSMRTRECS